MSDENKLVSIGDILLVIGFSGIAVGVGIEAGWPIAAGVLGVLVSALGLVAKRAEAD